MTVLKENLKQQLDTLDEAQLQEVNRFISFLKFRDIKNQLASKTMHEWANYASLYAEFADEDRQLAEENLMEYSTLLEHEDLE